jgi:cyanophycinase
MAQRLLIIGGSEAKDPQERRTILRHVAGEARARIVVLTVATQLPRETWEQYRRLFRDLGASDVVLLDVRTRDDAYDPGNIELLTDDAVCFLTGGDQLRITSQLGNTPVAERLRVLHAKGNLVCGTSAGAAAISEAMLIGGPSDSSGDVSTLAMGPGLGLLPGAVIDSHFAERGRIGRLIAAIAQNPAMLGIGIDENTAIVVTTDGDASAFRVLGGGSVYVLDGSHIRHSNVFGNSSDGVAVCDLVLHVLRDGDGYDLRGWRALPAKPSAEGAEASER